MAPEGETSIVLEIPCQLGDRYWNADEPSIRALLTSHLGSAIALEEREITAFKTYRIPYAYPILEVGFEEHAREIAGYMKRFRNLHLAGRSAIFRYVHIHDLIRAGREIIEELG